MQSRWERAACTRGSELLPRRPSGLGGEDRLASLRPGLQLPTPWGPHFLSLHLTVFLEKQKDWGRFSSLRFLGPVHSQNSVGGRLRPTAVRAQQRAWDVQPRAHVVSDFSRSTEAAGHVPSPSRASDRGDPCPSSLADSAL